METIDHDDNDRMNKSILRRPLSIFLVMFVFALLFSFTGSLVQSNFGTTDVSVIQIEDNSGNTIVGKLYIPDEATNSDPQPAALLLHGLNNDKDTQSPLAIELSKRGMVVLAIDEFNHGSSDNTADVLGGEGSDLGAVAAFDYLADLDYVDASSIGLVGHSMGGFSANQTAFVRSSHKAIVFQAFGPQNLSENAHFNNYLQIWPRYEESVDISREDWIDEGTAMITYNVETAGFTVSDPVYGTTYGSFDDGSAQRYALIDSTHPGGTWKSASIRETVTWLLQALKGQTEAESLEEAKGQTYYLKELLMLVALILVVMSIIPLAYFLLELDLFKDITQPLSPKIYYQGAGWWRIATLNALIGGVTFVIFPFIGVLLFSGIHSVVPIFGLLIGNGFLFWFLLNALIAWLVVRRWKRTQDGLTQEDLGGISSDADNRRSVIGKSLLLAIIIMAVIYIIAGFIQLIFNVELRYMWAFFRLLRPDRFFSMIPYFIGISLFFLINGGSFLFGQARSQDRADNISDLIKWWIYNVYNMLSIIILVFMIEYFPMFLFGTKPLLGNILTVFWLLGIFLMQVIPEFIVLFLIMTVLYNRTGRYYLGSFLATIFVVMVMINGAFNNIS